MKSSLTFQILLHLGSYYFGAFVLTEVLLLLYKFIGKLSCSNYSLDLSIIVQLFFQSFHFLVAHYSPSLCYFFFWCFLNLCEFLRDGRPIWQKMSAEWVCVWHFLSRVFWEFCTFWYGRYVTISSVCRVNLPYDTQYFFFQAYILRLELIMCAVQLTVQGLQLIFSLICLISFYGGTF